MALSHHGYKGSRQWRTARNKRTFNFWRLGTGAWLANKGAVTKADPKSKRSKRKKAGK